MKKSILFVSGVARSGTSALVRVLNSHPDFYVGMERYFFLFERESLNMKHFEMERFVDVQDGDTHGSGLGGDMGQRRKRYERARFVGDKYPLLYRHFDKVLQEFPEAKHIYIVRNPISVMESYDARYRDSADNWSHSLEKGLRDWNASLSRVIALSPEELENFYFVEYENYFSSADKINMLFEQIGANALSEEKLALFVDEFNHLNERLVPRRDDIRYLAAKNADWESYKQVLEFAARGLGGAFQGGAAGP